MGVAKLVGDGVVGAGHAGHNPDERLVCAELGGDRSVASVTVAELPRFDLVCVGGADVDDRVSARLRDKTPRLLGRELQLLRVSALSGIMSAPPLTSRSSKSNTASLGVGEGPPAPARVAAASNRSRK